MTNDKKRMWLYIIGSAVTVVGGYFIYRNYRITKIYETTMDTNQANQTLDTSLSNIPDINPADYQQQDDEGTSTGTTLGDESRQEAVRINGVVYVGSSNSGLYVSSVGSGSVQYDDNAGSMFVGDATIDVPPSSVEYGYVDSDGNFNNY